MCIIGMSIEVCGEELVFGGRAGWDGQMRQSPHLAGFVVELAEPGSFELGCRAPIHNGLE
jgi:hypothetical protein